MKKNVQMYCGTGKGKTAAAIGKGIQTACQGETVFVVSFLKGKGNLNLAFLKRLEPEIQLFTFDRFNGSYDGLTPQQKQEERIHVQTGLNFARKVIVTGECDLLILDEILDLARNSLVTIEELISLIDAVGDNMEVILTGTERNEKLWPHVGKVTEFTTLKDS